MKTGIFIFTKKDRKSNLKNTLYFLFKNYNHKYKHPVYILSNDLSNLDKEEILLGIRGDCRNLVNFKCIVLKIPDGMNSDEIYKMSKYDINTNWCNMDERHINYYMLFNFWEDIGHEFDYIMKISDDVYIEEPIKEDFFTLLDNRANNILFCILSKNCGFSSFSIIDFLKANFDNNENIDSIFNKVEISDNNLINSFKLLHKDVFSKNYLNDQLILHEPTIPNDCFMVIRTSFITNKKMEPYLNKVKELNYVYKLKWSFNLVISVLSLLLAPEKVSRCIFKISQEHHRCANIENGKLISNIPDNS